MLQSATQTHVNCYNRATSLDRVHSHEVLQRRVLLQSFRQVSGAFCAQVVATEAAHNHSIQQEKRSSKQPAASSQQPHRAGTFADLDSHHCPQAGVLPQGLGQVAGSLTAQVVASEAGRPQTQTRVNHHVQGTTPSLTPTHSRICSVEFCWSASAM
jgi:hypothetical protein